MITKYYEDDIIEILNGEHRGERFYVKSMADNYRPEVKLKTDIFIHPALKNIRLYHRPFKNHFKAIFNK